MTELKLIERIRARVRPKDPRGVVLGIGDDCAVVRRPGSKLDDLYTTDMMLENVHFHRFTHPAAAVGWKTLARGLSDIAAMGGEPRFCLVSLALGQWTDEKWLTAFYRGLLKLADQTGTVLAGGDLARAEMLSCDVVVCGFAPRGKALRRDTARPGDLIYVSGRLGGAAAGLETGAGAAWKQHSEPMPRLGLGKFLRGKASSAMDLSDGLSLDLHRLGLASKVAAELEDAIPVFPGATREQALHGGEDYELLFTAPPKVRVPESLEGLPLTRIGRVVEGKPGIIRMAGKPVKPLGFDHFRTEPRRRSAGASDIGEFPET